MRTLTRAEIGGNQCQVPEPENSRIRFVPGSEPGFLVPGSRSTLPDVSGY